MIRGILSGKEGPLIFLGITEENVRRMRTGDPLLIDASELLDNAKREGLDTSGKLLIVLHYGRTHEGLLADMQEHGLRFPADAAKDAANIDRSL
jgi:hypothetical protein